MMKGYMLFVYLCIVYQQFYCTSAQVNGGWTQWSTWDTCSVTCAGGAQTRSRTCTNPEPQNGGAQCSGSGSDIQQCNTQNCPVSRGGAWDNHLILCWRKTEPQYGGAQCSGSSSGTRDCNTENCPVNGGWTLWTAWGTCSVTCAGGTQTRSRTCTNPLPQYGGAQCAGSDSQDQQCNTQNCPVDGGWTLWTSWGDCSVTCAGGTQTRSRTCTNPTPQYGGLQCSGSDSGSQQCNTQYCPVNGGWTLWTAWGTCSVTCAGGTQTRSRTCTNPTPQYGGLQCSGSGSASQQCNTQNCPVIPFGQPCRIGGDKCEGPNTECRSSTCQCVSGYYWNGNNCVINVALGGNCQGGVPNECSDPNAECINRKCTCSVGFYWFNKGSSQSNCRLVQELQVTGITFQNVKTIELTLSWTAPIRSGYVSGYDVEWQNGGKLVGASSPQRVTGLIPGKAYEVKVISKDTATQTGVARTTYTSKQQAAKPSIPGAVTTTENDLDARDRIINIKWTSGTGVASLYRVRLFDGDTQKASRETSSLSTTFNNVLNGYRYSVRVKARSQQFNGDYLWSETKVSTIKTKVQVPESPRNGVCKSPTDSDITLDWDEPSLLNGDLVRYHINVLDTSNNLLFRDQTTGTETQKVVGNLQPGTNYNFRLYTENEGYNSTNYDQVSSACKTRAKSKVYDFKILEAPNGNYTLMRISWKAPTVIAGDIIKEYRLIYFRSGESPTEKTFLPQLNSTYEYSLLVDVIPERTYSFEVYAIDIQNIKGESITEVRQAPAGVPFNVEKNLLVTVQVISSLHSNANYRGNTRLAVTVVQEFFEETTYGTVRANGIIACVHVCKLSGVKTLLDFNTMANWKQAKDSRLTQYRITSPSWMDSLKTDQMNVSCTNGGCLLSKEYGPFFTLEDTAAAEIESTNVAVIVGVVLGVIIVILALYAGYVSMVLRGYRSKEAQSDVNKRRMRKGPIYANESFLTGDLASSEVRTVGTLSNQTTATNLNIDSEYLRLDDNTRDDKGTYDSIQNI